MDPIHDCPICFESYEAGTAREEQKLQCCSQALCIQCQDCLARCPFCRVPWRPEEVEEQDHAWQRRSFPNPIIGYVGATLAFDVIRAVGAAGVASARTIATAAAAVAAEASPAVIAGSVAGGVALTGVVGLAVASQHSERQAERLRTIVRSRQQQVLQLGDGQAEENAWRPAAACLWEVVTQHLSPQKVGMPHVYHGSPWRSWARERQQDQVQALLGTETASGPDRVCSLRLWGDLFFCYNLWLDFNPHTANWGSCPSYGLPPMHLCWHNRWREDLRHVASDLARYLLSDAIGSSVSERELACIKCLLAMLDHVLSWEVTTLDRGWSDLIEVHWWNYPDFCTKLKERFAFAWASALAPAEVLAEAEVQLASFDSHVEVMATRAIPSSFQMLW
eukprot:TRINITY_DN91390_c0_g1_i1.p1 TRINITY_DN91390_c0_g1~~TRINITY_DN91390_c0_g1_i1.p1  ORF type:complete len:402 (-),score=72.60 TRINITY_DN91390_c0_g1_i1:109-1284(-)